MRAWLRSILVLFAALALAMPPVAKATSCHEAAKTAGPTLAADMHDCCPDGCEPGNECCRTDTPVKAPSMISSSLTLPSPRPILQRLEADWAPPLQAAYQLPERPPKALLA